MKRIHRLSLELANQIAAGEVIERPASVLKELLENSLDANSTQIDVVIEKAGVGLIKVQDNGHGIQKEDLELALAQHATSKISDVLDLEAILSYGFRGEALASIASVSKVGVSSCTATQEIGWSLEKSTSLKSTSVTCHLKPSPRVLGTLIEVRDLFYNTPARRKFLRSDKTEMHYLEEVFKRIVLSHPEVSFSIKTGEKSCKRFNRCLTLDAYSRRVGALCGNSFIENAKYLEAESNGLLLKGWLGNKAQMRATADLQYFYVNGRIVRDKGVNHAVRQAYQEICTLGRYPAYILFLELDPAGVDVNVHPTKHEVRFREARTLHAFLTYALGECLGTFSKETDSSDSFPSHFITDADVTQELNVQTKRDVYPERPRICAENMNHFFPSLPSETIHTNHPNFSNHSNDLINSNLPVHPLALTLELGKPLCLLGGTLLLMEELDGFCMIDIQGVYQKLLEIDLQAVLTLSQSTEGSDQNPSSEKSPYQKPLLMPLPLRFQNQNTLQRFKKLEVPLHHLGFSWTDTGPESILLRAVPTVFMTTTKTYQTNTKLFENLFKSILEYEVAVENTTEMLIECMTQHIAQNDTLTLEKSLILLQQAQTLNLPKTFHSRKFTLETLKRLGSSRNKFARADTGVRPVNRP